MNLIPMPGKIFVTPNIKTMTAGGIIIPETNRNTPTTGVIIAAGRTKDDRLVNGTTILFRKHSEEEVEVLGEKCYLIVEADVIGVVEGGAVGVE